MAKIKNRDKRKKAPIMGLMKPYDYDYLWDEIERG